MLPDNFPPIVITQHIPAGFSAAFAERLNQCCAMRVSEGEDGELLEPGHAFIAPGNRHISVAQCAAGWMIRLDDGPKLHYQRPAVDLLFRSVAQIAGRRSVGVLLTGMGKDGAEGLLEMRRAGCHTIAQDESTCVVFGMPHAAIQLGAAWQVLPLTEIAAASMDQLRLQPAKTA
jgi:two-component system chemotaxis response regulator CheB